MDLAQCRAADWRAIGYEDGRQGRDAAALGARRKDCADHGVTPHFQAYRDGHGEGIAEFCRPQNGYRLGTRGYRYGGVCPARLEPGFLAAHGDGYGLYQRRVTVSRLKKKVRRKHKRSQTIEKLLAQKTAALVVTGTTPAQRLATGVELKQLAEERVEIAHEIVRLEYDLERAQEDYQGYRSSLARY
jgi:hypothetical protein